MTFHEFNLLSREELKNVLFRCCGSSVWVDKMMGFFPMDDLVELLEDAEEQWYSCSINDWKEAFAQHPKIGNIEGIRKRFASTATWAASEQAGIAEASESVLEQLAEGNEAYEQKFGYIFIISAAGKTAEQMLVLLRERLNNDPTYEIEVAAEEQCKILLNRLQKLFE